MPTQEPEVSRTALVAKHLHDEFPRLQIVTKRCSWLMRFLALILRPVLPQFMTQYVTTVYQTIYVPEELLSSPNLWITLFHERQHLRRTRLSFLWQVFLYTFPQNLALLAGFGLLTPWAFLFLLFLAPLPAPFRVKEEARGYAHGLRADAWSRDGPVAPYAVTNVLNNLTGASYYYASRFSRKYAHRILSEEYDAAGDDELLYRLSYRRRQ